VFVIICLFATSSGELKIFIFFSETTKTMGLDTISLAILAQYRRVADEQSDEQLSKQAQFPEQCLIHSN